VGKYRKTDFGDKIKYVAENGRTHMEYVTQDQVEGWAYGMGLSAWMCSEDANQMWNGYPDADGGNSITVDANRLPVLNGEFMDDDGWTIDGRPIKRKMPVIETWKGYDVMATNGGIYADQNDERYVLVTREGMLPYIPITRKQYLDRAMQYITRNYDGINKKIRDNNEKMPAQLRASKEEIDNQTTLNTRLKNEGLKKLNDELEKTTKDGLLDAPAVIRIDPLFTTEGPIFQSEEHGGTMLVTENPSYFRTDLPKYVPQFFVFSLSADAEGWSKDFKRIVEENFPVEILKSMIDK